jgi:hypothetical protein
VEALFFLFVVIIIFPVIRVSSQHSDQNRLREDEWRELAQRLGLDFNELKDGERMVDGYYRRYEVGVYSLKTDRPTGDLTAFTAIVQPSRSTCVVVVFEYPLDDTGLSLSRETRAGKVGKLLLGEDVLVGDETFDSRFLIRSKPEELAKRVFSSPDIRRRLLEAGYPALSFDGKELRWMTAGVVKDIDHIHFLIDLLCDIADAIRKTRASIISY